MFDGWTLPLDTSRLLVERLRELRPALTVECGSGASTVVMSLWSDRHIALDHDPQYAAPWPPVRICEIVDGWYQTDLPDGIQFALIDGPPGKIGRHNTFPNLWAHLADEFEVWVDDADRPKERAAIVDWQRRFPIDVQRVKTERGLAIIRRSS